MRWLRCSVSHSEEVIQIHLWFMMMSACNKAYGDASLVWQVLWWCHKALGLYCIHALYDERRDTVTRLQVVPGWYDECRDDVASLQEVPALYANGAHLLWRVSWGCNKAVHRWCALYGEYRSAATRLQRMLSEIMKIILTTPFTCTTSYVKNVAIVESSKLLTMMMLMLMIALMLQWRVEMSKYRAMILDRSTVNDISPFVADWSWLHTSQISPLALLHPPLLLSSRSHFF